MPMRAESWSLRPPTMNMLEWRKPNIASKNVLIGGKEKPGWGTMRSEIGRVGITIRPCHCPRVGSSAPKLGERKKTGNHVQSSESRDRFHPSRFPRIRFTPRRRGSGDTATPTKPIRQTLPLTQTQSTAATRVRTTKNLGQSNWRKNPATQ